MNHGDGVRALAVAPCGGESKLEAMLIHSASD
jgi:hypothetical protein